MLLKLMGGPMDGAKINTKNEYEDDQYMVFPITSGDDGVVYYAMYHLISGEALYVSMKTHEDLIGGE